MIKRILKKVLIVFVLFAVSLCYLIKRPTLTSEVRDKFDFGVEPSNLRQHVKYLSHEIKERSYQLNDGLKMASNYIESEFRKFHEDVSWQSYQVKGDTFQNIIASHGPNNAPI